MKKVFFIFMLALGAFALYSGDVSHFVMLGFSQDGGKFAFGLHGVQDKTYQAYAQIYIVDAYTNEFLEDGVFKTSPTKTTYSLDSKSVFLALQNRASFYLKKYGISDERQGRTLYSQRDDKSNEKTLIFRDFQTSSEYTVVLHSQIHSNANASFYITCDVIDSGGAKHSYKVGNPSIIRHGTKAYTVKKIILDSTNSTLVFVIEKKEVDKSGDSIRYMVEVLKM